MHVAVIASTEIHYANAFEDAYGYDFRVSHGESHADSLAEAAGRICYKSFNRPNPSTAENAAYLAHIIDQGHFSVMEHASVTFLVRGVSRAMLAELTRHRHISFSVVSQRYVDYTETEPVIPPAVKGTEGEAYLRSAYGYAVGRYAAAVRELRAQGLNRKQAREAARAVLPNAAPVEMVVTGNLRAWRDVLAKRWHEAADAEIREFAGHILDHLRNVAPGCVQDIPTKPYGG